MAILLQSCASAPSTATLGPQPRLAAAPAPRAALRMPPPPAAAPALQAPAASRLAQIEAAQQVGEDVGQDVQDAPVRSPAVAEPPAPVVTHAAFTVAPQTAAPARPRAFSPALQDGAAPNLFGSVALVVSRTPEDGQWRRIANSRLPAGDGPWTPILEQARGLSLIEQLRVVNASVNRAVTFTSDEQQYGVGDYWATARETLTSGRGDCEDYAIAKLQLLEALGVPADDLYLVIARDLDRQADHAVLAVRAGGRFWILDSGAGLMPADSVRDYRPIMTFSANHAWLHGYRRAPDVQVASAGEVGGAH